MFKIFHEILNTYPCRVHTFRYELHTTYIYNNSTTFLSLQIIYKLFLMPFSVFHYYNNFLRYFNINTI